MDFLLCEKIDFWVKETGIGEIKWLIEDTQTQVLSV